MDHRIRFLEEMGANAHVALYAMQYDGWLLRFSDGHTNRANSISVLYPSVLSADEKIPYCEACYRARNLPCIFKLTDQDTELNAVLEKRGYQTVTPTDVMISDLQNAGKQEAPVTFSDRPTEDWLSSYFAFEALNDPNRQEIFRRMLARVQVPACYASLVQKGHTAACASIALEHGYALLQNVVVHPDCRGRGYGEAICRALLSEASERGAQYAWLQVVRSNQAALNLYRKLGFRKLYGYWYMKKNFPEK